LDDIERTRATLVLIFPCRHDAEGLADVLLVDANNVVALVLPVVAFDDDGDLVLEPHDLRLRNRQAESACQCEADVLVLRMAVELAGRRLQDMRGGQTSGRNAPAATLQQQSGLRLRSGEAELTGIVRQPPGSMIGA